MTVCMLIWDYWPGREGGAQRQCRKLSHALAQNGVEVMVVTQRGHWLGRRAVSDRNTRIVRLGALAPLAALAIGMRKWKIRWSSRSHIHYQSAGKQRQAGPTTPFWWLARLSFMMAVTCLVLRNRRHMDLIHVHEANWIAGFASWLGAKAGLPVVCKVATWPCLSPLGPDVPFRAILRRWQKEPHFVALYNEMAEELKKAEIEPTKIHVIPNGVTIPDNPAPGQNDFNVLCIANFSQETHLKAYDILFRGWDLVRLRNGRARLIMVGGGDSSPWRTLARQLGCEDSISFAGSIADLDRFFIDTAVFVLPSRIEGMSNALLESQSWGIPAVVSAIPGNRAVVDDETNGLVVPMDDARALAAAIVRLLADPAFRARLGGQARQRMIRDFSIASVAARIASLYREIAAAEKTRRGGSKKAAQLPD